MAWYRVLRRAGIENRNRSTKKRWMFSSLVVARGGIEFYGIHLNYNDLRVLPASKLPPELPPAGLRCNSPSNRRPCAQPMLLTERLIHRHHGLHKEADRFPYSSRCAALQHLKRDALADAPK